MSAINVAYSSPAQAVAEAIDRSISHTEIVFVEASGHDYDAASEMLDAQAEDHAANGMVEEYWGADPDGSEWRVHLGKS